MPRRSQDDAIAWDDIERQFRLGRKSNKQLALEFNVHESSIGRRAKRFGWEPDKSEAVSARSQTLVAEGEAENARSNATPTMRDIEVAAQTEADLVLRRRRSLRRLSSIHEQLSSELEAKGEISERSHAAEMGAHNVKQEKLTLNERAEILRKLVDVDERLRRGECEAYGISSVQDPSSPIDTLLRKVLGLRPGD